MGMLQIGISAMVIENKGNTLTITTFYFSHEKSSSAASSPEIVRKDT